MRHVILPESLCKPQIMIKHIFYTFTICMIACSFSLDTASHSTIDYLDDKNGIYVAWRDLYERDQKFRAHLTNDSLDCQNLIEACRLVSKYGYPKKSEMGKYADTPWLTWSHSSRQLKNRFRNTHLAFPMIYQGYVEGEISEFHFMT